MTGIALLVLALVLSWLLPPVLVRARWLQQAPRAGVTLWQAVALAAVLAAVGAVLAIPEEAWRSYQNAGGTLGRPALFAAMAVAGAGAGIIVVRLGLTTLRLGLDSRRRRARHRELLDLLATPDPRRVQVLAGSVPMAYCVPGQDARVVLTGAAIDLLEPGEVEAVIEHERAHLRARHDLVREAFTALHVAFPTVVRSEVARHAVDHLLELLADDAALARAPRAHLRGALETLADTTDDPRIQARLQRLAEPEPSLFRRRGAAALAYLLAVAVLVVPTAVLAGPWLLQAGRALSSF